MSQLKILWNRLVQRHVVRYCAPAFNNLLVFALCFSLAFSSLPFARAASEPSQTASELAAPDTFADVQQEAEIDPQDEASTLLDAIESPSDKDHPLDTFRLLRQEVRPISKMQTVRNSRLEFRIMEASGEVKDSINGSALDGDDPYRRDYVPFSPNVGQLEILYRGVVAHIIKRPVMAMFVFDGNLIFVEKSESGGPRAMMLDLDYFEAQIGRGPLPIFELPLDLEANALGVKINGMVFEMGSKMLSVDLLHYVRESLRTAFNVTAALSNPEVIELGGDLINEFADSFDEAAESASQEVAESFERATQIQDGIFGFAEKLKQQTQAQRQAYDPTAAGFEEAIEQRGQLAAAFKSVGQSFKPKKKLMRSVSMLWSWLSAPRAGGTKDILQAMGQVAGGLCGVKSAENKCERKDESTVLAGIKRLAQNPYIRRGGATVAAGVVAGLVAPEATAHFFHSGLSISRNILGSIGDLYTLFKSSLAVTADGFSPSNFYDAYLSPSQLPKTTVGVTAIVGSLYATLGLPHMVVNTIALVKDLKSEDSVYKAAREAGSGRFQAFRTFLIERQNKEQERYLEAVASSVPSNKKKETQTWTEDENQEALRLADEVQHQYANQRWEKLKEKVSQWPIFKKLQGKTKGKLESFKSAMAHFLFSYASFTRSGSAYTSTWQVVFALRSFVWSPHLFPIFVAYPRFFSSLVFQVGSNVPPSKYNGGLRSIRETARIKLQAASEGEAEEPSGSRWKRIGEATKSLLTGGDYLKSVKEWEKAILPIEEVVHKAALRRAFQATIRFFQRSDGGAYLKDGRRLQDLAEHDLSRMTVEQRSFFRLYYQRVFDSAMENVLATLVDKSGVSDASALTLSEEKRLTTEALKSLKPENIDTVAILNEVESDPELLSEVEAIAKGDKSRIERASLNYKAMAAEALNPDHNLQVSRMKSVARQMSNPRAMARAVRAMIASNLIDKPMELLFLFLCMAGIDQGLLKPIQDQMFGDNSFFYLSRYVFSTGFIMGTLTGVLANVWLKLQQDELHEGKFDHAPSGEDAKGSYLKFFMKHMYKNPDNSWWKNQMHFNKIIWANMRAAFTLYLMTQLPTLGRFDLDSYLIGYLFAYFAPFQGIAFKIEQAFELSVSYFAKDVPEKFQSHPKVQEAISQVAGKKRLWFNFWYKIYENLLGNVITTYTMMSTKEFGTRSMARILFGDLTPTEWVVIALKKIESALSFVPGIEKLTHACDEFLTRNYEGMKR